MRFGGCGYDKCNETIWKADDWGVTCAFEQFLVNKSTAFQGVVNHITL
jgi:hypothetical protein